MDQNKEIIKLKAKIQALEQLLSVYEQTTIKQTNKLQIISKNLKASNEELQQFAYIASHDLQEPLRMVASYVQLLEKRYKGKLDKDADEFIGYAVDGAKRMKELINDLLMYSRIQTRKKEPTLTKLEDVFKSVINNLKMTIEESGTSITHDPLPTLTVDATQIMQLFQNLIANAIKFRADKNPKIHIGVEKKEQKTIISISDNGIGMDMKFAEKIFIIFQRLHTREEHEGTGIGLAICKRIIERHGGEIWIDSKIGEGTTFYFSLLHQIPKEEEV